jgi:ubiquinone/menaquinone biosynthesis C-methylase UbiE
MDHFKLQHELFRHIWQRDYSAPVTEILEKGGAHVLDIGCGSGVWVTEMSKAYPLSHFTGIDIIPISPSEVTTNSTFRQWNFVEPLPFESKSFDYVHSRNALEAFCTNEWIDKIIPEIVRITKPKGFVELCEIDDHYVNEGPIMKKITNAVMSYNDSRKVDGMIGEKLDKILFEGEVITGNWLLISLLIDVEPLRKNYL